MAPAPRRADAHGVPQHRRVVQTVELLLDEQLDASVREAWRELAEAGLPSLAGHTSPSNRPHVTLAVASQLPAELDEELATVARQLPLQLRLGGLLLFPHRRVVVARLVVPSAALLALHTAVQAVTAACPAPAAFQRPGAWTPHVTLARAVVPENLDDVVRALDLTERSGLGTTLRRWDGDRREERWIDPGGPTGREER